MRGSISAARSVLVAILAAVLLVASGCATDKRTIQTSGKLYTEVAALAADSTLVAHARVVSVVARTVDDGGDSHAAVQIPVIIYALDLMSSNPSMSGSIQLVWPDTDKVTIDDYMGLTQGKEYVFFLDSARPEERGGLQGFGTLYLPVGEVNGVFEVSGGTAQSLGRSLVRMNQGGSPASMADGHLSTSVGELLKLTPGKANRP